MAGEIPRRFLMARRAFTALPCLLALGFAGLAALPAAATTYRMMSDRDLTDQAGVVAAVRVVGAGPASRHAATDYVVEVDEVLKGSLPASTVVVRVVGGTGSQGIGLKIWGAPTFTVGERAILFLLPESDGTYGIVHLMLGAFHERPTLDGRKVAIRDLSEARAVGEPGPELYRDFRSFSSWILDRGLGFDRPADYLLPAGTAAVRNGFEKFAFLMDVTGAADRWFHFDQGRGIDWRVFEGGQPGLGLDDSIAAFRIALQTWNDDPRTDVRYNYVGTTSADAGFDYYDGVNAIVFEDPHRDGLHAVPGSFTCPAGGVIAVGGPWFYSVTRAYGTYTVHESVEADVITNDGTECLFRGNRTVAEEVFTHEVGHSLGLGHTDDRDAIMFASAHNDGRGSSLRQDDRDGLAEFYKVSGPSPAKVPNPPAKLTLRATASNQVMLTWNDKSNNEGGFLVEARIGRDGGFQEVGTVPANARSVRELGLDPGETYSFRLRAYNRKGFSRYSNTATIKMPR
jgi:hypothetical protein